MRMLVEFQPPGGDKVVDLSLLKHRIRRITEQLQVERTPSFHHRQQRTSQAQYIEDIYFFEVNTKYISSRVLKTSEFS